MYRTYQLRQEDLLFCRSRWALCEKTKEKKRIKGREEKIATVHEGWLVNGKRTKLVNKRHYVHEGKEPFWEGFEGFLINTYGYNPSVHFLVINGDGAPWITTCRNHF